ncbi:MAG: hypothetical protein ACRD9R_10845 [Pyrinomonadaceae bacterium]
MKHFPQSAISLALAGALLVIGLTACPAKRDGSAPSDGQTAQQQESTYRKLSKASDDLASGIRLALKTKQTLAEQKVISADEELRLTRLLIDVNRSGEQFNLVLRYAPQDNQEVRSNLLGLLDEVTASVGRLHREGVLHIKNEGARQKVALLIDSINAAVRTMRVILETRGGTVK